MTQFLVSCPFYPDFSVDLTEEELEAAPFDTLRAKIISVAGDRINTPYTLEAYEFNYNGKAPYHFEWWKLADDESMLRVPGISPALKRLDRVCRLRIVPQDPKSFIENAPISIEECARGMKKTTPETGMVKMRKNLTKAIAEHLKFHYLDTKQPYPLDLLFQHALWRQLAAGTAVAEPVAVSTSSAYAQGVRPAMEDAHFSVDIEQGHLAGVFDGHCGDRMSKAAAEYFPHVFEKVMRLAGNDVYLSFNISCKAINESFVDIFEEGTTAVVSFIDYGKSLIYTAALGDSEARIYRRYPLNKGPEEMWSSIPISNVRDWTSESDIKRASKAYAAPKGNSIMNRLRGLVSPKITADVRQNYARLDYPAYNSPGPNVSRALGDHPFRFIRHPETGADVEVVSVKPKITVCPLKPGDRVILACDGLFNSMAEKKILEVVKSSSLRLSEGKDGEVVKSGEEARKLVDAAIGKYESDDNVTVVALRISARRGDSQHAMIGPDEERNLPQGATEAEDFNKAVALGASLFYEQAIKEDPKGLGLDMQDLFHEWMEDYLEGRLADWEIDKTVREVVTGYFQGSESGSLSIGSGEPSMPPVERFHLDKKRVRQKEPNSLQVHSPSPKRETEDEEIEVPLRVKTSKAKDASDT